MVDILEHIGVRIFSDEANDMAEEVAQIIAEEIEKNNKVPKKTVLGLGMSNTALDVYRELISLYEKRRVDFKNVITFNLEEYCDLPVEHVCSARKFMEENLFNSINILRENIHIPDGLVKKEDIPAYCKKYEDEITAAGGIDILVIGIGGEGHIGFNDPNSAIDSSTRLVKLDESLRIDGVPDFGDLAFVPTHAITMGVGSIRKAKRIILLATGDNRAPMVQKVVEGKICSKVMASYLQNHEHIALYLDQAAASKLTRCVTPWLVGPVDWTQQINRARAVCHLSEFLKKPIMDLESRDFLQYSLKDLILKYPTQVLTSEIMALLKSKIMTADKLPKKEKILIFSPHPDDDIISMGNTMLKLIGNGNEVHSIYMTPGSNAVFDHDVEKFLLARIAFDKVEQKEELLKEDNALFEKVAGFLKKKKESRFGMIDTDDVRNIKTIIRQAEGASACLYAKAAGYKFLNPPFYQSGKAKKYPLTSADIDLVWSVLQEYKPTIVYAAGDLTDPNGTHRLCLMAIIKAFERFKADKPILWLYRGAWQEFHPAEADAFVVMSDADLKAKREGIFRHQSQKDRPPQPGHSNKEFWQSSEDRNLGTAKLVGSYGFPGLFALEGLKIYKK